jgi:hypothetical protein
MADLLLAGGEKYRTHLSTKPSKRRKAVKLKEYFYVGGAE